MGIPRAGYFNMQTPIGKPGPSQFPLKVETDVDPPSPSHRLPPRSHQRQPASSSSSTREQSELAPQGQIVNSANFIQSDGFAQSRRKHVSELTGCLRPQSNLGPPARRDFGGLPAKRSLEAFLQQSNPSKKQLIRFCSRTQRRVWN